MSKDKTKKAPKQIGINIEGAKGDPEHVAQVAQSIVDVLQAGFESRSDPNTVQKALDVLARATPAAPRDTVITGSSVQMGRS